MALALIIIINAIAFRGACTLMRYDRTPEAVLSIPEWTQTVAGKLYVRWYAYSAIPLACLNGFMLEGLVGLIVAGVGSSLGMFPGIPIFRFSPEFQVSFFGANPYHFHNYPLFADFLDTYLRLTSQRGRRTSQCGPPAILEHRIPIVISITTSRTSASRFVLRRCDLTVNLLEL